MDYISWLGQKLTDGFDWSKAQTSTMPHFLEQWTLHDSYWVGFWMAPPFQSLAIFQWDRVWLERRNGQPIVFPTAWEGAAVGDWPLLIVQFERVWKLECSYLPRLDLRLTETIGDAQSKMLDGEKRLALLNDEMNCKRFSKDYLEIALDEPLFHTSIEPIYESWMEIWHGGETKFLCLDASGKPLFIPDL